MVSLQKWHNKQCWVSNFNTSMALSELPQYYRGLENVRYQMTERVKLISISEPIRMQHACCAKI